MNVPLKTSNQITSAGTPNFMGSLASPAGPSPSDEPGGLMTGPSGQCHVPASLSARQAKEAGLLTSGICGPLPTISSTSAALQSSLESRLRARTASVGSTLYRLTWKDRVTPSGRVICALRASGRPISDSGSGLLGWPTPNATDSTGAGTEGRAGGMNCQTAAQLAHWNTPRATDGSNGGPGQTGGALPADAALAGWPTATTRDWKDGGNPDVNVPLNALLGRTVWLAGWPTPQARDHFPAHTEAYIAEKKAQGHGMQNLNDQAPLADWSERSLTSGPARLTASGEMLTGSTAGMESGGQLNPRFSLWLMGYPDEWACSGERAMQSFQRQRRPSSKRPSKPSTKFSVFD